MKFDLLRNKEILVLCLCIGLAGCASTDYLNTYKTAIKAGSGTVITKEEDYQELKQKVAGYFTAQGYSSVIYSDDKNAFYVYSKDGMFQEPCHIILKYTLKPNDTKIRIDLIRESDTIITQSQVDEDIKLIADQIKNN